MYFLCLYIAPAASQSASDSGQISGTQERYTTQNAGQLLTLTLPSIVYDKDQVIIISISFLPFLPMPLSLHIGTVGLLTSTHSYKLLLHISIVPEKCAVIRSHRFNSTYMRNCVL